MPLKLLWGLKLQLKEPSELAPDTVFAAAAVVVVVAMPLGPGPEHARLEPVGRH